MDGIIQEHKMFRCFNNRKMLLDRFQYFKLIEVKQYLRCCLKKIVQ